MRMIKAGAPVTIFEIWEPRWHDRVVLVNKMRVTNHNVIVFTRAPSLPGVYYFPKDVAIRSPLDSNGKIACYAIDLDLLEEVDYEEASNSLSRSGTKSKKF